MLTNSLSETPTGYCYMAANFLAIGMTFIVNEKYSNGYFNLIPCEEETSIK